MIAAGTLRYPMAVATYRTLIGLLAVTGLRIGEAARLDDTDFDLRRAGAWAWAADRAREQERPVPPAPVAPDANKIVDDRYDGWLRGEYGNGS